MVTRENSAKVRTLRIRSRIYGLSFTSSDMFGCSSTELKEARKNKGIKCFALHVEHPN